MPTKNIIVSLITCLFFGVSFAEDLTPTKIRDINLLLDVTGTSKLTIQFANGIVTEISRLERERNPKIPDEVHKIVKDELMAFFSEQVNAGGGLYDQIVSLYGRNYTHNEIKEVLKFYTSPTGKKLIATMPEMLSETMAIGTRWAEESKPELSKRLDQAFKKAGYSPK